MAGSQDSGLAAVRVAIDNLTAELTEAIREHTDVTVKVGGDIVAAIDRLIESQTPPVLSVDAFDTELEHRYQNEGPKVS